MQINRETLLCRYWYDPLDRLVDCTPSAHATTRRFYLKDRLVTEIQGAVQRSIIQQENQLFAEQQRQSGTVETRLLATDQQRSVLTVVDASPPRFFAYTPYGHRPLGNGLLSLLGFNGERPDPVIGCYLLGNGYRAFNPVMMRFNSPDSSSPFGEGGLNGYDYCGGDPLNRTDPTGHSFIFPKGFNPFKGLRNMLGLRTSKAYKGKAPQPTGKEYLVGYHGTTAESADRLIKHGPKEGFAGANSKLEDLVLGEGFYVAKDRSVADEYAQSLLQKNERTIVLEVYVKDMPQKITPDDYDRGVGVSDGIKAFYPQSYADIKLEYSHSFRRPNNTQRTNENLRKGS